jgi:hypothetical protein
MCGAEIQARWLAWVGVISDPGLHGDACGF